MRSGKFSVEGVVVGDLVIQNNNVNIHNIEIRGVKSNIFICRHIEQWDDKGKWPEHNEQVAFVNILKANKIVHHSIPNGGKREEKVALALQLEGLSAGVPDLYVFGNVEGKLKGRPLAVEMKRRNGSLSDISVVQWKWLNNLSKNGWLVLVGFGFAAAVEGLIQAGFTISTNSKKLMEAKIFNS